MPVFKGITDIGDQGFTDALKANIINYLDYGFVDAGAYFNVSLNTSGQYGGSFDVLRPVSHPNYLDNTVWQSKRKNWVWENDLSIGQPIGISGVYVDDVLIGSGYAVDYNNGRIVFDSPQSQGSVIKLEYSYKWVTVEDEDYLPFFKRIEQDSFRVDNSQFIVGSGHYIEMAENRVQMPVIGVEIAQDRMQKGYQLGSYDKVVENRMLLNIFAETDTEANKIADILSLQQDQTIFMYNPKSVAQDNKFPLDYNGSVINSGSTWTNLTQPTGVGGYRYTDGVQAGKLFLKKVQVEDGSWLTRELYHKTVRITTETVLYI